MLRLTVFSKFCSNPRAVHQLKMLVIPGCLAADTQRNEAEIDRRRTVMYKSHVSTQINLQLLIIF